MARVSYGLQVQKRAKRLLFAILAYANDEFDVCNEAVVDAIRPNIQVRWLTEKRLVIRTKVRFLQELTGLQDDETILKAEQIKEALKRFTDFIEILEDNRVSKGGSENWHFTLNLWYSRWETEANLQQFDSEWEKRKVKQGDTVKISTPSSPSPPSPPSLNWNEICRQSLEADNHKRLTTNPLTSADGVTFALDEVYVPLGLVKRKHRERRGGDVHPGKGSQLYESEDGDVSETLTLDRFLQQLESKESNRIAILGEPGAGKTTLLQKIASWLADNTQFLPIWVSLADLQGKNLEDYLIEDWLKAATRKRRISAEMEDAFCEQFNQGRVWLLLDAVDEMAIESSLALSKIADYLKGWVADASVIITCRLNVWDAGKNALEDFETFRNLNFTYGNANHSDLMGKFINCWFRENPELGENLQAELQQHARRRIRDAVKNPLRLALMCRIWGLRRGGLPNTKAMLYEKFVEAIYEWKQDRFPTTSTQRKQLNQALGKLALMAFNPSGMALHTGNEKTKFRLRHRFICEVLGAPDEGMFHLALQLGWLNQVGISETQGEKVYAFYHPTFQEYFAALAINDWQFFVNSSPSPNLPIFEYQWKEVILLWFGRDDIPQSSKEEFIKYLIEFEDGCGGFYRYQAYFLAAEGIAEFADCSLCEKILKQLIQWRFGYFHPTEKRWWRYPSPISESARVSLLKTDRNCAITALEEFIASSKSDFDTWNAAYSLGNFFDPGNKIAISTLEKIIVSFYHENFRLQAADSLSKIQPGNSIAIAALANIIQSTKKESIRRKAAFSLGKCDSENKIAISTLEKIITSSTNKQQKQYAAENLLILSPENKLASINELKKQTKKENQLPRRKQKNKSGNNQKAIAALIEGIATAKNDDSKRRRASSLAKLQPHNQLAFDILVNLVKSAKKDSDRKNAAEDLKKIIDKEQMFKLIASLKDCFFEEITDNLEESKHCYKLLWYCAEKMNYQDFYRAWND
ncbi:putative NTPase (NACHT family) [Rivularia sp. PCC 7116]|uniref:NACHT domain-containing protein n=1 Tax=Rivularia sp. PCC 7116 TaxID=373994 RepID=UPI00029F29A5|nr:NACHT domain-containing protein [Rivularia sp. PCC 7116]AFY56688.1 putative NTPase (NACHT family) [Rivularia sp. PCC 7116]